MTQVAGVWVVLTELSFGLNSRETMHETGNNGRTVCRGIARPLQCGTSNSESLAQDDQGGTFPRVARCFSRAPGPDAGPGRASGADPEACRRQAPRSKMQGNGGIA